MPEQTEAQRDLARLLKLKPKTVITSDNPEGLSMRRDSAKGAAYRKLLDEVLARYGGAEGFESALASEDGLPDPITDEALLRALAPLAPQAGTAEGELASAPIRQASRVPPIPTPGRSVAGPPPFAEFQEPRQAPPARASISPAQAEADTLDEQLITQQRLFKTLELAQQRVEGAGPAAAATPSGAPPKITDADLLAALEGTRRNPPGPFEKLAGGAGRVAGAASTGFDEAFGADPITGTAALTRARPELGVLEPFVTGPAQLASGGIAVAEGIVRGIPAVLMGAAQGFEQAIIEFGGGKTNARNATTMALGLFEASTIVAGGRPVLMQGALEGAKRVGRFAIASSRKEALEARIVVEKAQRAKFRAVNKLRDEIRRQAPAGTTEARIRSEAFDVELRRMDDAAVRAQAEVKLFTPDEIITDIPSVRATVLPIEIQRRAIKVAQDILIDRGIPPNSLTPRRVQQLVADLLNTDVGFSARLFADINAAGMTKAQFLQSFLATGSEAGRTLQARKAFFGEDPILTAMRELARTNDDAARVVQEIVEGVDEAGNLLTPGPIVTASDLAETTFTTASRMWRTALISQPTTAARNLMDSGFFRSLLGAMNQAIDQTLQRVFLGARGAKSGVVREELEPIGKSFEILARTMGGLLRDLPSVITSSRVGRAAGVRPLKPSKAKQMLSTLHRMFPEIRGNTFANIELDLAIQTGMRRTGPLAGVDRLMTKYLLALNRGQEFIVRRASLTSRLDAQLKKIGSSLEDVVDNGRIPAGFNEALKAASDEALLLTFAMSPKQMGHLGAFFEGYATVIEKSRVLIVLEPFPRFIFNATKLIMENTATGGLRLMKPLNRAKLAQGDFSPLARELTGTALLATAIAIRQGDFPGITPGARFDEVIGPGGLRVSMAPFATIIPHLFLADLLIRIEEGRLQASTDLFKEFRKGLLSSAPQQARAAEGIEDAFKALLQIGTKADFTKFIEFMGESVGAGAFRPMQLIRDFRGEWNEAFTLSRETRGQGGLAGIRNIVDPTGLPERESPTRAATPQAPRVPLPGGGSLSGPLFSQVSGAPVREPRNPIEKALVTQGFLGSTLSPKTGSKRADALVNRFSGPMLELLGNVIVTGDLYLNLPNAARQEVLRNLIIVAREPALALAKKVAPTMFAKLKLDRIPNIRRRAIEQSVDVMLKSAGVNITVSDLMQGLERQGLRELEAQGLGAQGLEVDIPGGRQ